MAKGYDDVSLADVAVEAGLARTAIYNYFSDREALLFAWTDREVKRSVEGLKAELSRATTSAEKLWTFVRYQLDAFTTQHLPPGQEVIQFLGPDTYRRFMDHVAPLEAALREVISEGVEAGEFEHMDAAVPMVLACIGSERVPLATGARDVDEATERVTEFLLRALMASPPTKKRQSAAKSTGSKKVAKRPRRTTG